METYSPYPIPGGDDQQRKDDRPPAAFADPGGSQPPAPARHRPYAYNCGQRGLSPASSGMNSLSQCAQKYFVDMAGEHRATATPRRPPGPARIRRRGAVQRRTRTLLRETLPPLSVPKLDLALRTSPKVDLEPRLPLTRARALVRSRLTVSSSRAYAGSPRASRSCPPKRCGRGAHHRAARRLCGVDDQLPAAVEYDLDAVPVRAPADHTPGDHDRVRRHLGELDLFLPLVRGAAPQQHGRAKQRSPHAAH